MFYAHFKKYFDSLNKVNKAEIVVKKIPLTFIIFRRQLCGLC